MANHHAQPGSDITDIPTQLTEYVVGTVQPFTVNAPSGNGVMLYGTARYLPGNLVTATVIMRLRRGLDSTGEVVVGPVSIDAPDGVEIPISIFGVDTGNQFLTTGYVFTVEQQGEDAIGPGTVSQVSVVAQTTNPIE